MAAKAADIGSKRLIGLAPTTWVRWLTGDATVEAVDFVTGEFEWVSRSADLVYRLHRLGVARLRELAEIALAAASLDAIVAALGNLASAPGNGSGNGPE